MEREDPRRRSLYLAVVGAVVFYLGYLAREAVVPLLVALLLAYVLAPLVARMEQRGLSRIGAVSALFLAFFGTAAAVLALGVPPLLDQGRDLVRAAIGEPVRTLGDPPKPAAARLIDARPPTRLGAYFNASGGASGSGGNFERRMGEQREERGMDAAAERVVAWEDRNHNGQFDAGFVFRAAMAAAGYARERSAGDSLANGIEDLGIDEIPGLAQSVAVSGSDVARGALGAVGPFLRLLGWLLILPLYTFFFLMRLEDVWKAFVEALPGTQRDRVVRVLHEIHRMLIGFFRGRLLTMLLKGVLAGILLAAVGVPYWPVFGAAAGLLTIVPAVGPLAVAVPAVWLTFAEKGGTQAGMAAAVFVALEVVEGYVLIPRLIGREVGLHPMAVVTAILVGGALLGGFGVVIAIPLAASAKIVWGEFVVPAIRAKAAEAPRGPGAGPPGAKPGSSA